LMRGLLDGEYRLGDPWKLPKGAGFVLPLLGEQTFPERGYVLLQEVADRVEFRDSGSIYGVEASNRSGRNVFVRRGTLLTGKGTQSRSPVSGVVLVPGKEFVTIPVNCVHQSHYISTGADFKAEGVAPHSVYQALGKQSATWESIAGYTRKMRSSASRMLGRAEEPELEELRDVADDNLVGASAAVERLQSRVEDALGKIPGDHVDQVGVAVFDLDGVVGVELFDHPDSWRAFSESIIRSYGEVLTREVGELYDIRMDRAEPVLKAFLQKAEASERAVIAENSASKVYSLRGECVEGELACIEGNEIHLALARSEGDKGEGPAPPISMATPPVQRPEPPQEGEDPPEEQFQEYLQRRGGYPVLDQLSERAQRFGELLRTVRVSRGTLATRLREAEEIGLVQKAIRKENGSPAYALTEEGKEAKKKGDEKAV